jgi:hypothetical protein
MFGGSPRTIAKPTAPSSKVPRSHTGASTQPKNPHGRGYNGTAKLSVSVTADKQTIDATEAGAADFHLTPDLPQRYVDYHFSVANDGTVPLEHTILHVSISPLPTSGVGIESPLQNEPPLVCPNQFPVSGEEACQVGSAKGVMAPESKVSGGFGVDYVQVPGGGTAAPSVTVTVSASGVAPGGQVVKALAAPAIVKVVPADINSTLTVGLSFQPDRAAPNQWFTMTVTLVNHSPTETVGQLMVLVPQTPGGDYPTPSLPPGANVVLYPPSCQGLSFLNWICEAVPSQTLAPGASESMKFWEAIAPGEATLDAPLLGPLPSSSKGVAFWAAAAGLLTPGRYAYASAIGYEPIS